jgi:ribosomal protein L40E
MAPPGRRLRSFTPADRGGTLRQVPDDDRTCPSCGASVSKDAEWCWRCLTSLRPAAEPEAPPNPVADAPAEGAAERRAPATPAREPFWPCSVCGAENPIALDTCSVCGTPFAHVMRAAGEHARVDPRDAVVRSLIFPGLGHRALGRSADGLARGVLFAVTFGLGILLAIAAAGSAALVGAFVLFLVAGIVVYAMSAIEAHRLASGGSLLVPTQVLMWVLVGVVFVGITLLVIGVVNATHR